MSNLRHVLIATDLEESSAHAVEFGTTLAAGLGADLTLMHACEFLVHSNEGLYPGAHVLERLSQAARQQLDGDVAAARKRVPGARGLLRQGSAWQEVLAAIDEVRADLVVLGTHGRRGVERFMLGSVAERVVQRSPVPTIVVP